MTKKEKKLILLLAACLCVLLIAFCVAYACLPASGEAEFVPPAFDSAACAGTPRIPEGLDYRNMDIREDYRVAMCVNPGLEGNGLQLYFTAHADNDLWVSAVVYSADGRELGQTGLLRPGEYVELVQLQDPPAESGEIFVKVRSYDTQTYYSLGVINAQIYLDLDK